MVAVEQPQKHKSMFGNNSKKETSSSAPSASSSSQGGGHSLNSIVQGTNIEGTIKASSDLRVDGHINGKLFCDAKIIIGPTGKIEGEISCQNAVIEGDFKGTLNVKELLNIRETAKVQGDISYSKLIVQPGGVIEGTLSLSGNKPLSAKLTPGAKQGKVAG